MVISQFECLLALVKYQSFTEAANHLFITRPGLSRRIVALERDLGIKLLERNRMSKSVRLTPAGDVYYEAVLQACRILEDAETKARAVSVGCSSQIRLGVLIDGREQLVMQAMQSYQRIFPGVSVHISQYTHKDMEHALLDGAVDMAFFNSHSAEVRTKVGGLMIERSPHCVIVNDEHPWAGRDSVTIEELEDQSFVLISPDATPYAEVLRGLCAAYKFEPKVIKYGNVVTEMLNYASYGIGIGFGSGRMAQLASQQLHFIPIAGTPMIEHLALWRRNNDNPNLQGFLCELKKVITEHP